MRKLRHKPVTVRGGVGENDSNGNFQDELESEHGDEIGREDIKLRSSWSYADLTHESEHRAGLCVRRHETFQRHGEL